MNNHFDIARQTILEPAGLVESDLQKVLDELLSHQVDLADLYFQNGRLESWSLEDGIIKSGHFSIENGVGVRAVSGEKTGFAYSDVVDRDALFKAASAARSISSTGSRQQPAPLSLSGNHDLYSMQNPVESLKNEEKIALLKKIDEEARAADPRVVQVMASLVASHDVVLVAASDGTLAADVRPLIRCNVSVLVEENGRRERGGCGGGGRRDFSYFMDADRVSGYVSEAVRVALVNLEAQDAPAGLMPVVLGPGWPGVLLHEAVGHGLEGDFNRKGSSAFSGRIGEQVASSLCTVVDDGTLENRRGSLGVDDEGTAASCTTLIENGVLKGYMQDKMNAGLMGQACTGNGRRESYAHLPMPRMTNTYMLAGETDPGEMIASIERGLYAVNFAGGQVDITSGKFVFSTSEAYLVENGKVVCPVKGATLIGNGPEAMNQISMVGNDLELDAGIGVCGKDGQSVPVGVGQPSLKVDELTVGGTGM